LDADGQPVICDLGLSRETHNDLGQYRKTTGLQIPIRWSAPEVLNFAQPQYFFASDVWSMGVVVWQLLTRHDDPYPDVSDNMEVVRGLRDRSLDLRTSLPTAPQWAALSVCHRTPCCLRIRVLLPSPPPAPPPVSLAYF
jgi:serine/threonine protein kinase